MPSIRTRDVDAALLAVTVLIRGRRTTQGDQTVQQPPMSLPARTGVKLARLKRALATASDDARQARTATLRRFAVLEEDGSPAADERGAVRFPSPEAEAACRAELAELLEARVEIPDALTLADFRRRERDPEGRVYETDQVEPDVIDALGELLVADDAVVGATDA